MARKKGTKKPKKEIEKNNFWKFVGNLPTTLAMAIALAGAIQVTFLLLGILSTTVVVLSFLISLCLSLFIAIKWLTPTSKGSLKESRVINLIAVVFVFAWLIFNSFYTSQNIYQYRDPAVYNITARWLMDNEDLNIPVDKTLSDGTNEEFINQSSAFHVSSDDDSKLYAQGLHLLPVFASGVGRLTDESKALKTNVIFGAVALLALYSFIRIFVKPRYAFLGIVLFSFSLPFLYFSRDMYTEPLLVAMLFSSLALLYQAMKERKTIYWAISGILIGASTMVRVDSYLPIFGMVIGIGLFVAFLNKRSRNNIKNELLAFIIGCLAMCTIGLLDLVVLSKYYYETLDGALSVGMMFSLLLMVIIIAYVAVVIAWKTKYIKILDKATKKWRNPVLLALLSLMLVLAIVAPMTRNGGEKFEIREIAAFQSPILIKDEVNSEPSESTALWVVWYLGLPVAIASLAGLLIYSKKFLYNKNFLIAPFLAIAISVSLFYLFEPKITPDHVWASRRLLTVTFPAIIFFSMVGAENLFKFLKSKWIIKCIAVILPPLLLTPVIIASSFYILERTHSPSLSQVESFCNALPENSAIMLAGNLSVVGIQAVRTYCGVDTHGYSGTLSTEAYKEFYQYSLNNDKVPVVAFYFKEHGVTTPKSIATRLGNYKFKDIEKVFRRKPNRMYEGEQEITVGILKSNGDLRPLVVY